MRVLVLLPTTGAMNRVLRIEARPDLPASGVYVQGDFRPQTITSDYNDLTAQAGPLAALAPPVKAGPHRLWLAAPIEAGKSWELPVLLAHLVVAHGATLTADPADADLVLWSTGAVDLDLRIVDYDYRVTAKAGHSRAVLTEAAAAGRTIIAFVPACEDPAPLRGLLAEIGAQHCHVDVVDGVCAAQSIVERALTVPSAAGTAPVPARRRWKTAALLAVMAAMAVAFVASPYVVKQIDMRTVTPGYSHAEGTTSSSGRQQRSAAGDDGGTSPAPGEGTHGGAVESATSAAPGKPAEGTGSEASGGAPGGGPDKSPETSTEAAPSEQGHTGGSPPEQPPAAPLVPLRLVELRDPNGRSCFGVLYDGVPPRLSDVAADGDRFHDSAGANLCGLEWTLKTPEAEQAGVQGFDIDLPAGSDGARLDRTGKTGAPGVWTTIRILFTREFGKTINYHVNLKFTGAPPPQQVKQFQHTIR